MGQFCTNGTENPCTIGTFAVPLGHEYRKPIGVQVRPVRARVAEGREAIGAMREVQKLEVERSAAGKASSAILGGIREAFDPNWRGSSRTGSRPQDRPHGRL